MRTAREVDMTKLLDTFGTSAQAPKNLSAALSNNTCTTTMDQMLLPSEECPGFHRSEHISVLRYSYIFCFNNIV